MSVTTHSSISPEAADNIRRDPPERMSLSEAAIYLGLSTRTVADYVKLRRIKAVKVGKSYIFSIRNLRAFIDG